MEKEGKKKSIPLTKKKPFLPSGLRPGVDRFATVLSSSKNEVQIFWHRLFLFSLLFANHICISQASIWTLWNALYSRHSASWVMIKMGNTGGANRVLEHPPWGVLSR